MCCGTHRVLFPGSQRTTFRCRFGTQRPGESWKWVLLQGSKEDEDGTLVIRVVVFNPDWDEPLQIANIKSRPQDGDCNT